MKEVHGTYTGEVDNGSASDLGFGYDDFVDLVFVSKMERDEGKGTTHKSLTSSASVINSISDLNGSSGLVGNKCDGWHFVGWLLINRLDLSNIAQTVLFVMMDNFREPATSL